MRRLAIPLLGLYLLILLVLTLVLFPNDHPGPNLIPFRSVLHDWRVGRRELLVNFLGNVIAFVPFGLLIPIARLQPTSWGQAGLACASLSATIEAMQFLSGRRVADVDDVMLNAVGGLCGFALLRALGRRLADKSDHPGT